MFKNLSNKLFNILNKIKWKNIITEDNIKHTLKKVKISLLEADVSLIVVKEIINRIKIKVIGNEINKNFTAGQEFIKLLYNELVLIMNYKDNFINLTNKLSIILMVGSPGSGKTTSSAKLAKYLNVEHNKKILLASVDIYRPAAIEQLSIISKSSKIDNFIFHENQSSFNIAVAAFNYAKNRFYEVLIIDTPGINHTDLYMMQELIEINKYLKPHEILFIIDSMSGQDAINIVSSFNKNLLITGIILTKLDGNSRCGSALSILKMTGIPIKFIGHGENINSLQLFCAEKISKRILGMEDSLSLIEDIENRIKHTNIKNLSKKIFKQNKDFNLNHFLDYLYQIKKIDNISNLINLIPTNNIINNGIFKLDNKLLKSMEAIIQSMTAEERINPKIIKNSRKNRISKGSGTKIQNINILLKKFLEIKKIINNTKNNNIFNFKKYIKNIFFK